MRQAIRDLTGEVDAGLYYRHNVVPCICQTIMDLVPSIQDLSLLFSRYKKPCMALCTADIISILSGPPCGENEGGSRST